LFNTTGTCAKCHVVNGVGKDLGPNLSEIGKKLSRQALHESILYPNAGISHNYETHALVLEDGNVLTGIVVSRTPDSIAIRDSEAITRTVQNSQIEEIVKQDVSLMPSDLQKVLTAQELVDIVAYMTTLQKAVASASPSQTD
jgi:putative heme-binding domain-containing protein